ncbi:hypothetical protein BKA61DRAFT_671952 [Leptodontidium sp. MPI-SDFR-AT-0119]|nr:hypothetical protein BKA61DRAFT_671952 [Leptodontidium sp. MPI-SDFR-AT-0119]
MLQIAYATLEPLPITEFFSAVNYVLKNTNPELESQSFDEMERRLLSRCRRFLEVQTASWQDQECEKHTGKIVQFLHQSVKDYLAQERSFETIQRKLRIDYPINGHVHLLKFFTSQHLRKYARQPEELYQLPQFDLRKFSVLYHSRMLEQTLRMVVSGPLDALAKYIDHNELTSVYLPIDGWECPESWKPSFLALATQAGLLLYVEQELRRLGGANKLSGRPLLHWAVMPSPAGLCTMPTDPFVNSQEMIRLLRRLGANLEEEFEYQKFEPRTAFGWAFRQFTFRGAISPVNLATLKTLLSEGANPNVLADQTMTALQLCVRNSDRLLARLLLDFNARIEILTAADWTHLERFNKPMSTIKAFRDGDLRARDMELFANFYAQEDDQQKPKNLLKQYPSGKLAIRNGEVYVGDWDFVLEYEKSVKRFFRFYEEGEWVGSSMPRPLAECGIRTKSEILLDWAMPPDTMDYWY